MVWREQESSPGSGQRRCAFPTQSVAHTARLTCPLQWRGRAGLAPASVLPVRAIGCLVETYVVAGRASMHGVLLKPERG